MKTIIIASFVLILIFLFMQSFTIITTKKTEIQKYTLIQKENNFEIRYYPSNTMATIHSNAKTYKELAGPGFRKLAGYIFGGNKGETKISMTSPVHMDINDTLSSMSFVMPSAYNPTNLPVPNDPDVMIKTTKDEYVAVIQFGGFANEKDIKYYSEKLQKYLEGKGINTIGHYRFLGYNPPFQVLGRRNEIIVTIEWQENKF